MSRLDAAVAELVAALREELQAEPPASAPDRLLSIPEAVAQLRIGRTRMYEEIETGRLRSVKVGRRRLVPSGAIDEFMASLR